MSDITDLAIQLGLNSHNLSDKDTEALTRLKDYAGEEDASSTIRSLENRLGRTPLGERRIDQLDRYIRLQKLI